MQQLASRPRPDQQANNGGAPRSQVILIVALLLFSVAGLASGFSVGAFTGKLGQTPPSTPMTSNIPVQKGPAATPTPKTPVKVITLGCPIVEPSSSIYQLGSQQADGATSYTFSAYAVDTTGNNPAKNIFCAAANRPIHAAGITFKLWLIKHVVNKRLDFPNRGTITQPINGKVDGKDFPELQNELQFGTTPQIQKSNNQGQVTWNYKIDPGLKDGTYTLVVLTDWQGKTSNWSWRDLAVKQQAQQ
jgi:hypothetical protein